MQVIFSCENTEYMWWQAELLHYTYTKIGMRSHLTALVSQTDEPPREFTCSTFPTANYKNRLGAEVYVPLNKPGSIAEWASSVDCDSDTVLIVDPDSVFIRPVEHPAIVRSGEAYADAYDYMDPNLPGNKTVLLRHCAQRFHARVQPVGIYILISVADLRELAPRWLEKAIDIKSDTVCVKTLRYEGWISEMLAYTIAAAELGIHHHLVNFSQTTGSDCLDYPITHYCYPLLDEFRRTLWSKWDYHPWDHPPVSSAATSEGRELLLNLAQLAEARRELAGAQ